MTKVDWLTILGTWFSGIGTLLASGVALWIAYQPRRIKLRASVGLRQIFEPGKGMVKELIAFGVTNVGEKPVTISTVGWRVGRGRKRRHGIILNLGPSGKQLPTTLNPGERATFSVREEDSLEDLSGYWDDALNWGMDGASLAKSLRGQIHTTLGYTKTIVPDKDLLDHVQKHKTRDD